MNKQEYILELIHKGHSDEEIELLVKDKFPEEEIIPFMPAAPAATSSNITPQEAFDQTWDAIKKVNENIGAKFTQNSDKLVSNKTDGNITIDAFIGKDFPGNQLYGYNSANIVIGGFNEQSDGNTMRIPHLSILGSGDSMIAYATPDGNGNTFRDNIDFTTLISSVKNIAYQYYGSSSEDFTANNCRNIGNTFVIPLHGWVDSSDPNWTQEIQDKMSTYGILMVVEPTVDQDGNNSFVRYDGKLIKPDGTLEDIIATATPGSTNTDNFTYTVKETIESKLSGSTITFEDGTTLVL